jgi:hypothetical protein
MRRAANARPMPEEPPVSKIVLPVSCMLSVLSAVAADATPEVLKSVSPASKSLCPAESGRVF